MRHLRCGFVLLLSALLGVALSGCNSSNASDTKPAVLRYAFMPQAEELQGSSLRVDLMRAYLERELHMPVEVVRVEGYAPTIEAMRADKVDVATYGALAYIIAAQKAGAEAIIARGFANGKPGGYRSVIAVPRESPYHSLADLKAHAKDIVFAFSDPASTSGNLYPRVGLLNAGIDPEKDFKKVVFAGTHLAAVMTVRSGKVDAGAFMEQMANRLITLHKISPGDVRIVWTSDLIPNSCTAVRKGLAEPLKKEIQAALLAIPAKDPELSANIASLYRTANSGTQYVAINDANYDGLRKYAAQVKDFNFVDK